MFERLKSVSFPFAIFLVLAIGLTWPLVLHLDSHLPAGSDSIVHYWNGWWVGQALAEGHSPYQTDLFFAPNGLSLVYHNFAWIHIVGSLILSPFLAQLTAYNIVLLINLALCGLSLFLLVRHVTNNQSAAYLAGLIYIAWPYRLTQPDHPNLHSTWPIPLFMLALIRLLERRRWQDGVWCGLAFALIGYMRWQLLIPATFIGTIYVLMHWRAVVGVDGGGTTLAQKRKNGSSPIAPYLNYRAIKSLFIAAVVTLIALAPPITLLVRETQQNPAQLVLDSEVQSMQTDLFAYATPAPWNSLIGTLTAPLYDHYYPNRGSRAIYSPFIGFTTLVLCAIALWRLPWRKTLPWLAISLTLVLLALGPTLRINGSQFESIPTFYRLLERLFIIKLLREPDRFNMFVALPAAVLAGYGVVRLSTKQFWKNRSTLWVSLLALLVLAEYLVIPLPLQALTVSPFYKTVEKDAGAILDIPLDPFKSKPYMLAQISHGRPIAQGHASRYPENAFAYLENNRWLNETLLFDGQPPKAQDIGRQLSQLRQDGFEFLVLHKTMIRPDYITKWKRSIPLAPYFEDDDLLVYQIGSVGTNDLTLISEPISGLGPLDIVQSATCQNPGGVLGLDIAWGLTDGLSLPNQLDGQLQLRNEVSLMTSERSPLTELEFGAAPTFFLSDYEWDLPADLSPGIYTFELVILDRGSNNERGVVSANQPITIQDEPCIYPTPNGSTPVNARLSDTARLLAYELNPIQDETLPLTLYWRPEQRTGVEYTVFVHLFDSKSGQIVSQSDAMPRGWSYPTSRWGLDETIDEQINLSLAGIAPGSYGLGVGLYNGATGERLSIVTSSGEEIPSGRLVLQTVVID